MRCLGIDPGLHGGYALIDDVRAIAEPFPLAGGEVDLSELAVDWRALAPDIAVLELVGAMPKQGLSSTFSFGRRVGELRGVLAALGIGYYQVRPQAWQKAVLAGTSRDKAATIAWARRAYPSARLVPPGCRVAHSGLADSLALAEYGRLHLAPPRSAAA